MSRVSEEHFAALAEHLAGQVRQPDFRQLRARRRQRTQRLALAVAVLVVLSFGLFVRLAPDVAGLSLHRPAASPSPTGSGPLITVLDTPPVPGSGGALYAVASVRAAANLGYLDHWIMLRSVDLGVHWTELSQLAWLTWNSLPVLYGGLGDNVWLFDRENGSVALFGDQAQAIRLWAPGVLGSATTADPPQLSSSPDGSALWARIGDSLLELDQHKDAAVHIDKPWAGGTPQLVMLAADRVLARGADQGWYLTTDSGASWASVGDPCAGTRFPGTAVVTTGAGLGTTWVACVSQETVNPQPTAGDFVATTDGRHWSARGASAEAAFSVLPVSPTGAWRYGLHGRVYRTADGTHWQDVSWANAVASAELDQSCVAVDLGRAVCFELGDNGVDRIHTTVDGGATWSSSRWPVN